MFRMNKVALSIACLVFSSHVFAAEPYDATQSYSGGSQVTVDGTTYEAKWWVGAGQSPTDIYANEWDSPWKVVSGANPSPEPSPEPTPDPSPEPTPDPTPEPTPDPGTTPSSGACADFNVYPDWTQSNHATAGDIMVNENVAYKANWWTSSIPGSDSSWATHLDCGGASSEPSAKLALPNPLDPVRLEVAGWPSHLVVASPATLDAPASQYFATNSSQDLADVTKLTNIFVALIQTAEAAGSSSIVLTSDVLDIATADKGQALGTVAVKQALTAAVASTASAIEASAINALTDDVNGWAQAHNLIISTLAPQATFGWTLTIGDFAFNPHSGKRAVWNAASSSSADLLSSFALYDAGSTTRADFIAFTKSANTAALSDEQWYYALEYVKQISDHIRTPALLTSMPTSQTVSYFMGDLSKQGQLRKAAHSNVFAILFDSETVELTNKIEQYQTAKLPLYYVGESITNGPLTRIAALNGELASAENAMNNQAFLYEVSQGNWAPSTVYKWADFLAGLNSMHNVGVAGNTFWLLDETVDDATNAKYAKVAIAAFLSQSMQETIRYNACDENNWSEVRYGAAVNYPMTASCGQLGQKYADYGMDPVTGIDHPYSCPRDPKMEVSALTNAKWYGAPAPIFAAPDSVLAEKGLLVNGNIGRWTNDGHCMEVPSTVDSSQQVWERADCKVYEGQKAGKFIWDGSDTTGTVEGCGWWGRGVIQTTGRQNFGTLNHFMGRSHVDPDTVGTTVNGVVVEAPPANPLYADLDFCSNPGLICSSEENREIKWIAGLFYWVSSVQTYNDEGGPYAAWNYHTELKKYVDGGMQGTEFIDAVSGIVNRGCPDSTCPVSGKVHAVKERQDNFKLVLQTLGLNPQ
ncbi:cellulose-binding domain-containing protein [Vibrio chaetopteri]|uniref:cellulose-binding domain-containing protein n=1 Tax=Vibrio chaetopteri TaxID=3016528 RepID=UPI003AB599F7